MPNYRRMLDLDPVLAHRSVFLLGPRQTGKSTLLRERYAQARYFDLLKAETFRELATYPESMAQRLGKDDRLVIIDEIQKLPGLLDEVQSCIDRDPLRRFILTGSSARKLKRGSANLLGGRAWTAGLHPLTTQELGFARIDDQLRLGSLPPIIDSPVAWQDLCNYVGMYLQEEIQAESLTRSVERFSRFFNVCAHLNAQQINYTKIGNDAGVPPRTVRDHVAILQDTLIAYTLQPFGKTTKRKPVATEKFYLFDVGVAHALCGRREIPPGTTEYGLALEHLVFLELHSYLDYRRCEVPLSYWRSQSGYEVDFLLGDSIAIEVKASGRVSPRDLRSLAALGEEIPLTRRIVVCSETEPRWVDGVEILPMTHFFQMLWEDGIAAG